MNAIEFVRGWRMSGEPWSMYLVVPIVGLVLLIGIPLFLFLHVCMKLLGFKNGIFDA